MKAEKTVDSYVLDARIASERKVFGVGGKGGNEEEGRSNRAKEKACTPNSVDLRMHACVESMHRFER